MSDQVISCPQCQTTIQVTDALSKKIQDQIKSQMNKEMLEKEKNFKKKEEDMISEFKKQKAEIEQSKQEADLIVAKKLESEKLKMWNIAQEKAKEKLGLEMRDLKAINLEKEKELELARNNELEFRKKKREMENREKNFKLEMQKKLEESMDLEREKIKNDLKENNDLKLAEQEKKMEQMKRALEDANRKAEQGSMQIQGDVHENSLKSILQSNFPIDQIDDVPTGIKGADLIQYVNDSFGKKAGIILWECKNTKTWDKKWIKKLKDDKAMAKADIAILVSKALPGDVESFENIDSVWVCKYRHAIDLSKIIRSQIIQVSKIKKSIIGKDQKMEVLYNYLSGSEFASKIENIVSAFSGMKSELETEKRSMQRIWSRREKEIDRVILNTSGLHGDLQGLMGSSMQEVKSLEMNIGDE